MAKMIKFKGQKPRLLTNQDVDLWLRSADRQPQETTCQIMVKMISAVNKRRWARLQKDVEYFKTVMESKDLNPEDLPWLL